MRRPTIPESRAKQVSARKVADAGSLEEIIPTNSTFDDFQVGHTFPGIGHKTMLLNARRVHRPGSNAELLILAMEDVTERRAAGGKPTGKLHGEDGLSPLGRHPRHEHRRPE